MQHKFVGFNPRKKKQYSNHKPAGAPKQTVFGPRWRAYDRLCHSPASPDGRINRMRISKIMPMPSLYADDKNTALNVSISPNRIPPSIAPTMLPSPPSV